MNERHDQRFHRSCAITSLEVKCFMLVGQPEFPSGYFSNPIKDLEMLSVV
jgi:hypothetical protein